MPDRCQPWRKTLLVLGFCVAGAAAMSAERKPGADGPPLTYRLDDVIVRVQRQWGHGQPMGQLMLAGKGQATWQSGDRNRLFDHTAKDHLNVLNGLYRIRFFDMPAQLRSPLSVFLKDDGTVGTQGLKMADAGSTTVCFSLPGYEKCVRYDATGPRELEDFVQRLLADAELRAQPATPALPKQ